MHKEPGTDTITQRLHVIPLVDLSELLSPVYIWAEPDELRGVTAKSIGAVISVEPYKATPDEPLEYWRLAPEATKNVSRHYTTVFYADEPWKQAKDADTQEAGVHHVINERMLALSETLQYADRFLKAPEHADKKLVIHDYCGLYFSPAVALAILSDQFPRADGKEIFEKLASANFQTTVFRSAELAFVDAATKRNGELVRTWDAVAKRFNNPEQTFDLNDSLKLHERFSKAPDTRTAVTPRKYEGLRLETREPQPLPPGALLRPPAYTQPTVQG